MSHILVLLFGLFASAQGLSNLQGERLFARAGNVTGGVVCSDAMCISGVVTGSTVQYVAQSTGKYPLGWMGTGFGIGMIGTPMVIMWPNSDGSVTLSQRQADAHQMPTLVSDPPRVATLSSSLISTSGSQPKLAYTIPSDDSTSQNLIWAFGTTPPDSSAADATLQKHLESGTLVLDLGGSIDSSLVESPAESLSGPSMPPATQVPLQTYHKLIIAHAVCCSVGFLFLLPLGALIARYLRTFTHKWFRAHSTVQFWIAGPVIAAGVSCAIGAAFVEKSGHLNDNHKKWGIAIFVLYCAQAALGAFIHFVKPKVRLRRPPQNYFHAVLGLLVIGLALYQVYTGITYEWPSLTGRGKLPNGVKILWYVWVALLPVLYLAGLALLPRQFSQERPKAANPPAEHVAQD